MPQSGSGNRIGNLVWLLALGVVSSIWCATTWQHQGPTFDETLYVRYGLESWRTGSRGLALHDGVMPLPADVQTLPIYSNERYRGSPYDPIGDLPSILPTARAGTLVFWWALLIYAFRWGHALGGHWGGRWASGLIATDPNFLAHAALATTDIAMTATVLIAVYHFYRGRERGPWLRVVLPGVLFGVALSAKASALPYVPILFAVVGWNHLRSAGELPRPILRLRAWRIATLRLRWDLCYAFGIGLAWVLLYTGSDWRAERQFVGWAESLPRGSGRDAVIWLAEHGTACFPNALEGLARQIKHGMKGHDSAFVLGDYYPTSVWFYFPVTLAVKLPDSTLALLLLAALFRRLGWRSPAVWAALVLLLFSLTTRVQIGIRIVFPLVAFLLIALGVALAPTGESPTRRRLGWIAGFAAMVYSAALCVNCWPDGIRFTNRVWGGSDRGAALLADSNYDWGQGLPDLKRWWSANGEPLLFVWFYGSDPQQLLSPFHRLPLNEMQWNSEAVVRGTVGDGYLAVSVSLLNACPDRRPQTLETIAWLKSLTPVARTRTAFIYKLK